jgi:hypothetical protein
VAAVLATPDCGAVADGFVACACGVCAGSEEAPQHRGISSSVADGTVVLQAAGRIGAVIFIG